MVYIIPNATATDTDAAIATIYLASAPAGTITITEENAEDKLGEGGVIVADFDGGGTTNDIAVAAHGYDSYKGRVYIFPNVTAGATINLASPPNGTITITGETADDSLGEGGVTVADFDGGGTTNDIAVAVGNIAKAATVYILPNLAAGSTIDRESPPARTIIITGATADDNAAEDGSAPSDNFGGDGSSVSDYSGEDGSSVIDYSGEDGSSAEDFS